MDMHSRRTGTPRLRRALARTAAAAAAGLALAACAGRASVTSAGSPAPGSATATPAPGGSGGQAGGSPGVSPPAGTSPSDSSPSPGTAGGGRPLAGAIVGIDPGHNGLNHTDPGYLSRQIWNGRELENCDTTGTQTAGGYTEAQFNFNVAADLRALLRRQGAHVVLTRTSNNGLGPCVNRRAQIINKSGAQVAVDIHADGGPPSGRGFTVLEPVADGPNNQVIGASLRFGRDVRAAMLARTPMRISDYYGQGGYIRRDDLAGLNLTTVPKVLIECGNMSNPADAALLTTPAVQHEIARALDQAIVVFLTGR